jgi:hypothetical protein
MRKSMIAGVALSAAVMAFAGQSYAYDPAQGPAVEPATLKQGKPAKPHHHRYRLSSRAVVAPEPQSMRIPANPIIRDCVHVTFPQCSRHGGLNDGTFGLPY